MHFMIAGRRAGKTTEAVRYLREDPHAVMVCASWQIAVMTAQDHPDIDPSRFVSVDNVISLKGLAISGVVVDNLDMILEAMLGLRVPVVLATATGHTIKVSHGA